MTPADISLKRRKILSGTMKLLVFIGLGFLSVPFISSFSTTEDTKNSQWVLSLEMESLLPGKVQRLKWSGGVVWVYRRTGADIDLLNLPNPLLADGLSSQSDQPEELRTHYRSKDKRYFVFIPYENKRGCQIRLNSDSAQSIFTESCYGARYDAAGRILNNSGHKEQQNLAVPKHIIEDGKIKIAIWTPKLK